MSKKKPAATPDSPTPDPSTETTTAVLEPPTEKPKKDKKAPNPTPETKSDDTPPSTPTEEKIALTRLKLDQGTQMRPRINDQRVTELREVKERGGVIDPIRVWKTPAGMVPSDGFHRIQLAMEDGDKSIRSLVFVGTVRDAIKDACSANSVGPMPRDYATKKKAVLALLADSEWSQNTVGWIAETAAVSKHLAHEMYQEHHERAAKEAEKRGEKYAWPKELKDRKGVARPAPAPRSEKPARPESSSVRTTELPQDEGDPDEEEIREPGDDEGEISDSNRPESDGKAVLPKAVDPSAPKELDDEAWIESLKRNGEEPMVKQLPAPKRPAYVRDALTFRLVMDNPNIREAGKFINSVARPQMGDNGIMASAIRSFWAVPHPRDWKLCIACGGSGVHKEGGPCQSEGCDGKGYKRF